MICVASTRAMGAVDLLATSGADGCDGRSDSTRAAVDSVVSVSVSVSVDGVFVAFLESDAAESDAAESDAADSEDAESDDDDAAIGRSAAGAVVGNREGRAEGDRRPDPHPGGGQSQPRSPRHCTHGIPDHKTLGG